ncbi:MAG TPA: ABC transporter substrate-binding protein [Usitatibacteraceae bacterium]
MFSRALVTAIGIVLASAPAWAVDPVKIGFAGPLSGGSIDSGESMRNGARLAVEQINTYQGGVLGRPIQLVERDDATNAEVALSVTKDLLQKEKVVAVIGFSNTGPTLGVLPEFQAAKVPLIVATATGAEITAKFAGPDNYIFRVALSDAIQPQLILSDIVDKRKLKKIAIFHDASPYGTLGRNDVLKLMEARGITPVVVESFKVGDKEMAAQVARAKAAGAEVVLSYCLPFEGAVLANEIAKAGWKVPLDGSWALSHRNFLRGAGKNAEGVRMPQTFVAASNNFTRSAFLSGYYTKYNTSTIPAAVSAAQAYDAMLLLAAAINQAKSLEGPEIKKALELLKHTVYGTITTYQQPFSSSNHEAITAQIALMGEVRNGEVTFAYKEDEQDRFRKR